MFGSLRNGEEVYNKLIGRRIGEAEDAVLNESNQVCVFKPGVQVKDNWGWCNGSCAGGNGCYDHAFVDNGYTDQCNYTAELPYIYYKGSIVVIP